MKTVKLLTIFFLAVISFNSCTQDDDLEFIAQPPGEFAFTNTFLESYVISPESNTDGNLGVLFTWNPVDFDAPTVINYQVQHSLSGDFTDAIAVSAATTQTQKTLTIGELRTLSTEAGLVPPAEGILHFRVRAYVGDATSTTEAFSPSQSINVILPQATAGGGISIASWGVIGSAYNDWGNGGPDGEFYTTDQPDVIVSYLTLLDGAIKFRENNDWANNLGDDGADGTLEPGGADINVSAGTYKISINLNDNTYTLELYSLGIVGSAFNEWGSAGPDAKMYYDYTTNTFKRGVKLLDGAMKFRVNNDWGTNYGGSNGIITGDDIPVTAGYYTVTLDLNNDTYSIEPDDIIGIVGSGYNDWGNAGPDFSLTEVNPDIWVGNIVTLVNGDIKFRVNNDWGTNYGGTAGALSLNGADINVVAGLYRVRLDLANSTYQLNKIQ